MKGRGEGTFDPRVVLGLLLFGALAFLATLYFIGSGQTGGGSDNDGAAHARGKGLSGYAALVDLLGKTGHEVHVSRNPASMKEESLLVLTPPLYADADEIAGVIANRRYTGPTLLILPKWVTARQGGGLGSKTPEGWVRLIAALSPDWAEHLDDSSTHVTATGGEAAPIDIDLSVKPRSGGWVGMGMTGKLPDPEKVLAIDGGEVVPLVQAEKGAVLAGYSDDGGYYPTLADAAGRSRSSGGDEDADWWAVTIVAEPDLMNNYGLADEERARLALALVNAASEGEQLPVVFDVTLNGLGRGENLLTLAFTPPFLAATLCLILAMIVVAWRAFLRFGPAVAEGRQIAFGKARLVKNSAGFIQRSGRLHLLGAPYAEMMRGRIARALGIKRLNDDAELDAALARRLPDDPPYSHLAASLRAARSRADVVRAAAALRDIERKIAR